jgi:hypothetical protein
MKKKPQLFSSPDTRAASALLSFRFKFGLFQISTVFVAVVVVPLAFAFALTKKKNST